MHAAYFFQFFGGDQSLKLGVNLNLKFHIPDAIIQGQTSKIPEYVPLIFHNEWMNDDGPDLLRISGRIKRIYHIDLGDVNEITCSNTWTSIKTSQGDYLVDTEEDIGIIYSHDKSVTGWMFTVDLEILDFSIVTMEQYIKDTLEIAKHT